MSMFIELIIEGKDTPAVFPIDKAIKMAAKLEKLGTKFRLGNTI